ncbi:hypothetical protein K503DRAFT_778066 [Rhizopogon vinicolor AM-OR11-026]|uniref:Uncharacterized protein n=1 Tax=Rhizopogon vinicolor AM-OR11-026 TaxID=1314800 RepID=A0A1B7MDL9_9AGAM|nr:hypothetical protein K503DRAFT_778066 [Rhizopogon vinicolor AM-OR11-026]
MSGNEYRRNWMSVPDRGTRSEAFGGELHTGPQLFLGATEARRSARLAMQRVMPPPGGPSSPAGSSEPSGLTSAHQTPGDAVAQMDTTEYTSTKLQDSLSAIVPSPPPSTTVPRVRKVTLKLGKPPSE